MTGCLRVEYSPDKNGAAEDNQKKYVRIEVAKQTALLSADGKGRLSAFPECTGKNQNIIFSEKL
jgi:hypothetical protein